MNDEDHLPIDPLRNPRYLLDLVGWLEDDDPIFEEEL